jgi:t-SNARE complex subunit (syntaxin)
MHLLICILSMLLATSHAAPSADTLSAVGVSAQRQLEESLAELTALRQAIAEEKVPMGRRLSELEEQLLEVRREYQQTMRLLDRGVSDAGRARDGVARKVA